MVSKGFRVLAVAVALALCVSPALAQSDESAAIIQTTLMAFDVTGSAAGNFSKQTQQAFSDNLRSLLSSYNFMSLAVSDFKVTQFLQGLQNFHIPSISSLANRHW